ncbi:cupin domain-containing protein [Mycobacteroides abscessus subsp. massiliense]|uniref:cupin domain-containing protein n=1 Tax=Mycobacteroides abscessus TaxID=36809 RepID=UPI0019D134A8|nr:cupin domain-containing protein [Mycobacteroides abscessus]MBN7324366.1 cupin domain-containing protein [Mycobacteroides abscessus subsp. massiliense]
MANEEAQPQPGHVTNNGHVWGSLAGDAIEVGRRGWVIGAFFDSSDVRLCRDLEVKYGEFVQGTDPRHPAKVSSTTEFTFVLSGAVRAVVGSDELILSQGDYVLIHPGTPNNTVLEVLEDAQILTVKAPSDPMAKREIGDTARCSGQVTA